MVATLEALERLVARGLHARARRVRRLRARRGGGRGAGRGRHHQAPGGARRARLVQPRRGHDDRGAGRHRVHGRAARADRCGREGLPHAAPHRARRRRPLEHAAALDGDRAPRARDRAASRSTRSRRARRAWSPRCCEAVAPHTSGLRRLVLVVARPVRPVHRAAARARARAPTRWCARPPPSP